MFISKKEHKEALAGLERRLLNDIWLFRKSYLLHLCEGRKWRFGNIKGWNVGVDVCGGEYPIDLRCFNCAATIELFVKSGIALSSIVDEVTCPRCGVKPQKKTK